MQETHEEILPDAVYTLAEACRLLRISEATARRWIKSGKLGGRRIGRDYRFLGRDLLRHFEGPSPQHPRVFHPGHPLLALAGIGSSGRSNIAEEHDRYLAEIYHEEAHRDEA